MRPALQVERQYLSLVLWGSAVNRCFWSEYHSYRIGRLNFHNIHPIPSPIQEEGENAKYWGQCGSGRRRAYNSAPTILVRRSLFRVITFFTESNWIWSTCSMNDIPMNIYMWFPKNTCCQFFRKTHFRDFFLHQVMRLGWDLSLSHLYQKVLFSWCIPGDRDDS